MRERMRGGSGVNGDGLGSVLCRAWQNNNCKKIRARTRIAHMEWLDCKRQYDFSTVSRPKERKAYIDHS